jgi:putative phage-type endonuclease
MKTLDGITQGSAQWHAARAEHFCASEAPAMLGLSRFTTRTDLLKEKATGISAEVDQAKQRLFDAGHKSEAMARSIAENIIGQDLFPIVGTREIDGLKLLASFDGIVMDESVIWEHKLWSASLAKMIDEVNEAQHAGDKNALHYLDPSYRAQIAQQLLVSGAEKCLFMCSDGTEANMAYCWVVAGSEEFDELVSGWHQFSQDLAAFTPVEVVATPVGRTPETLPALHIELTGKVTASNLDAYREHALAVFAGINRDLKTDGDFANAEATVKWCGDIEARLAAAKQHALSQTASIDALFSTIDSISAEARATRLELDKLVKARKETIRAEIVTDARLAISDHITALNVRIGKPLMPAIAFDFAGAIKGKRTLDSMRDAVSTELSRAKINANEWADKITINLRAIHAQTDFAFLFSDVATLVLKEPEFVDMAIKNRVAEHQAKEAARVEAQRLQIEATERAKAEAAERARADAEIAAAKAAAQAEAARASAEAIARARAEQPAPAATPVTTATEPAPYIAPATEKEPETVATMRLGQICQRLGFTLTADFVEQIGFAPVATDKTAKLYRESDFPRICVALVRHINTVSHGVTA